MLRFLWSLLVVLGLGASLAQAQAPQLAFPTAEGAGRFAQGGRGGKAYNINSLADGVGTGGSCNAGGCYGGTITLRDCLHDRFGVGARTCIFRVGGTIDWPCSHGVGAAGGANSCVVTKPYITIAGHTAPGQGVMIKHMTLEFQDTHDVIVRHLRIRPGKDIPVPASGNAVAAFGSTVPAHDMIFDHLSLSWAPDDTALSMGAYNITYQWTLWTEGLGTSKSDPSKVVSVGWTPPGTNMQTSLLHNLMASTHYRAPNIGGGKVQMVNNVIYNTYGDTQVFPAYEPIEAEIVNNYFKPGPQTLAAGGPWGGNAISLLGCGFPDVNCASAAASRVYINGNLNTVMRPTLTGPETAFAWQRGSQPIPVVSSPLGIFPAIPSQTSAAQAVTDVLAKAGARVPFFDSIDQRAITDYNNGTGRGDILDEAAVGGYPTYASGTPYTDTDGDGIPDTWELAHGLNPANAADGPMIAGNGYSNLENFLNELAGDPIPEIPTNRSIR